MKREKTPSTIRPHERWAHFRFSVIGSLLADPPQKGELQGRIRELAARKWLHPISGEWALFGFSTIERWYYKALNASKAGPVEELKRKIRCDEGRTQVVNVKLATVLENQHREHPSWSYQLHTDNLAALVEAEPELGPMPSYASVLRMMKSRGLYKRPRRGPAKSPGAQAAEERYENREIRSYECEYVNGLWHLDFHHGSLPVLLADGRWVYPILLGVLDDHSRLCCHLQWYLAEGAGELCHGLSQAMQKRALPRSILFDNGSAMVAKETEEGLTRLSVQYTNTLPYSPYQNGKQESFWGQVEGRLLAMLESARDLDLRTLNLATQAWAEVEYNAKRHSEIDQSPRQRYCQGKDVGRTTGSSDELRRAFTREVTRTQRRSDGTISLEGIRFEIPSRYHHLEKLAVRYASWDLSAVHLYDLKTGAILSRIYPLDKVKNARGLRASKKSSSSVQNSPSSPSPTDGSAVPPLLAKIIAQYAATGVPPAYLPQSGELDDDPEVTSQQ